MNTGSAIEKIYRGGFDAAFSRLYGEDKTPAQRERYITLIRGFESLYGVREISLFSVPGRTEIIGNHTDHNNGKVIAASVDLDIIAVVAPSDDGFIRVKSDGYREDVVPLTASDPSSVRSGSSSAIIAGVADSFRRSGYSVGGFYAYTTSSVLTGSGLSSSAAFEIMIGYILDDLYNGGKIPAVELAKAGKYAENVFFGKPCGLMDQTACALGGFAYIDFSDTSSPYVEKLSFDLAKHGYALCIVNTGGNHADLTDDYAAVPAEMKTIAKALGGGTLRFTDKKRFYAAIPSLRPLCGDRAILRALHFYGENDRVEAQRAALKSGNMASFLKNTALSGDSSFKYLQNVYTTRNVNEQGLSLALALCDTLGVTARVHGGGFAGTVQAFPRVAEKEALRALLEPVFGEGSCMFLNVRADGAVRVG